MALPFGQWAFSAGELTPSLWGHVDLAKYAIGLSTARNGFVSYRGGFYSRAGTEFIGYSLQTQISTGYPPRLVNFQFSNNQGLCLEFGNTYMRVISNGEYVVEDFKIVAQATQADPCVLTITAHGYGIGDWISLSDFQGMTQLNGVIATVVGLTTDTITIANVFAVNIDSTTYGAYVPLTGTASRIYTLTTPYADADIEYIKFVQSADVMSICCWNQQTGTLYPPSELVRNADDDWSLTPLSTGSSITAPPYCSGAATVAGTTNYQYVVTAMDKVTGEESVASPIANIVNSVDIGATAGSLNVYWGPVEGAGYYNLYKAPAAYKSTVPVGSLFGFAGLAYGTSFNDSNIVADFSQVPPLHLDPFAPGQIISVDVTSGGSALTTVTWSIATADGTGFDGFPVVVGGQLTTFVITNPGENYATGDEITFNVGGFANGNITFAGNPTAATNIVLNGVTWTFVSGVSTGNQTTLQGTLGDTMVQLASDLSASGSASLTVASYSVLSNGIEITYKTGGTAGNSYTLNAGTSGGTRSASTLTGGAAGGSAPTANLNVGPVDGTYPSVVSYYQQRRVYASTPNNPDTYFMSQPGAFTNYDSRIPTIDSDSIVGTPWSLQVNGIQFMVTMPGGLVTLTGLGAWQLTGAGGSSITPQAITPSNQQAQPQAYNGCSSTVPPIRIDYDIIYVQAKGSILRDLNYNFFTNIYTGIDLTALSSHMFTGFTIREMAWCEEPYKLLWAVRNDGVLLSLTFMKSQDVSAWARHDTNGLVYSVTSVTEPPVDALYLAVQRYPGNPNPGDFPVYMIERMNDRIWSTVEDAWCVDSALELPQITPQDSSLQPQAATGLGALIGITALIGGSGYSPGTIGTVSDPTGSGAGIHVIVTGGVITDVFFSPSGTGYSKPQIVFTDPSGTGTGASVEALLDNSVTIKLIGTGYFGMAGVGAVVRGGGGIATITEVIDDNTAIANVTQPFTQVIPNSGTVGVPNSDTPVISGPGYWSYAIPVTQIGGLDHLIGMTVTGLADGTAIPLTVVSPEGTITLTTPATQVTVGLAFNVQFQSLYLNAGQPTSQGRKKKIGEVTVRVEASRGGFLVGSNQPDGSAQSPMVVDATWTSLQPAADLGKPTYGSNVIPLYTGDIRVPISGGYGKPGQVAVQQSLPYPLQIIAIIPEVMLGTEPDDGPKPKQPQQQRASGQRMRKAA